VKAISPGAGVPLLLAVAAYNLAGIAGILAFAIPSGIGVREGVVVALMGAAITPPVALGAAVAVRLVAVAADFTPIAAIAAWHGVRRIVSRSRVGAPRLSEAQRAP
jgi:uncharacterized membrane protein YbhN (UPF0104 family)